tara:strand:+ start:28 stop:378 length:351 start_codon:yes stop_codon:yes gene_type:complete
MSWQDILKSDDKLKEYLKRVIEDRIEDNDFTKLSVLTAINVMNPQYDQLLRDKRNIGKIVMIEAHGGYEHGSMSLVKITGDEDDDYEPESMYWFSLEDLLGVVGMTKQEAIEEMEE